MRPHQIERPTKTFFFERSDGTTFATQEDEAWRIYSTGNQVIGFPRDKPKLVGVSDGTKMHQAVIEAHALVGDPEQAKDRLRKGYEEELESARGHLEKPRNMDTIGRGRQPVSINELR